ncbi:MFS transporter [Sporosarcina thermotolerans]|uniref:MFS transporter n=2 Tax=Sporosarcina thermotolerans TaxID=633404 RepID=A0AAW9A8C0_9BACL|nr:MFS transporter [Sporosarcina thermotolerans]MDW0116110.1 MFS transporter [Sporosarcina thermotolerans]
MVLRNVLIIVLGFQIVINATRPILTLSAYEMNASMLEIGILTASFAALPLLIAIQAGKIADKIGDRLPVTFGLLGMAVGMLFPYLFESIWSLYVSQILVGTSNVFIALSLQNVLGNDATKETRDYYFSMFALAVAGGALVGPVMGGYLADHFSYSAGFLVSMIISILLIGFAFFIPVTIKEQTTEKVSFGASLQLVKDPLIQKALFSSALVLYSKDIFVAYFPLYGTDIGLSTTTIGWILSIQGLAMMIIRFVLPKLLQGLGREVVLFTSILLAGASFLGFSISHNIILFFIFSCLMGFGLGCGQPISMTTTYNASPKSRTGEVLGIRLMTNRLSQFIAPVLFGAVGGWIGVVSVFYVSGAFLIGGAIIMKPRKNHDEEVST